MSASKPTPTEKSCDVNKLMLLRIPASGITSEHVRYAVWELIHGMIPPFMGTGDTPAQALHNWRRKDSGEDTP